MIIYELVTRFEPISIDKIINEYHRFNYERILKNLQNLSSNNDKTHYLLPLYFNDYKGTSELVNELISK